MISNVCLIDSEEFPSLEGLKSYTLARTPAQIICLNWFIENYICKNIFYILGNLYIRKNDKFCGNHWTNYICINLS